MTISLNRSSDDYAHHRDLDTALDTYLYEIVYLDNITGLHWFHATMQVLTF